MKKVLAIDMGATSIRGILGYIEKGSLVTEEIMRMPHEIVMNQGACAGSGADCWIKWRKPYSWQGMRYLLWELIHGVWTLASSAATAALWRIRFPTGTRRT